MQVTTDADVYSWVLEYRKELSVRLSELDLLLRIVDGTDVAFVEQARYESARGIKLLRREPLGTYDSILALHLAQMMRAIARLTFASSAPRRCCTSRRTRNPLPQRSISLSRTEHGPATQPPRPNPSPWSDRSGMPLRSPTLRQRTAPRPRPYGQWHPTR